MEGAAGSLLLLLLLKGSPDTRGGRRVQGRAPRTRGDVAAYMEGAAGYREGPPGHEGTSPRIWKGLLGTGKGLPDTRGRRRVYGRGCWVQGRASRTRGDVAAYMEGAAGYREGPPRHEGTSPRIWKALLGTGKGLPDTRGRRRVYGRG